MGFVGSQLGVLCSRHFGPFLALSVVVFVGALVLLGRMRASATRREAAVVLGVLAAFTMLSLGVHRTTRGGHALRPYDRLLGAYPSPSSGAGKGSTGYSPIFGYRWLPPRSTTPK
jgi:hypothetical protein